LKTQIIVGEGIENCTNEGQYPCSRGDNWKKSKDNTEIFLKSFSEPTDQFQSNLVQSILG
jgi:hypothetical protein